MEADAANPTVSISKLNCPSKSFMSLALLLSQSRPPGMSTRDFCKTLQRTLRNSEQRTKETRRCIDQAEFWKEQCERLAQAKHCLEMKVFDLELQLSNTGSPAVEESLSMTADEASTTARLQHPRHTATESSPSSSKCPGLRSLLTYIALPLLLRARRLQMLSEDHDIPAESILAPSEACLADLSILVEKLYTSHPIRSSTTKELLSNPSLHFAPVYDISCQALSHLCRDISGRRVKGRIIGLHLKLFQHILDKLHISCCPTIDMIPIEEPSRVVPEVSEHGSAVADSLSILLVGMLCAQIRKAASTSCVELMEGCMSLLLTRLGRLMSPAIFDASIALSDPSYEGTNAGQPSSKEEASILVEGRYLASVLRVISKNDNGKAQMSESDTSTATSAKCAGSRKNCKSVLGIARRRLQATLLCGLFGEDHDVFVDALKAPQLQIMNPAIEIPQSQIDEAVPFVYTVWEVLGWDDVLA